MKKVPISTEFITLGQLLKYVDHVGTGGEAKIALAEEEIRVDGEREHRRGRKLYPGSVVEIPKEGIYEIVKKQD